MKAGRKKQMLTEKEMVLMQMFWQHGELFVREMLDLYPDPKPHFNTLATTVRILEGKGYVGHRVMGGSHQFYALAREEDFRSRTLAEVIRNYFGNSYKNVVSCLAEEEKISVEELKEIIELVEKKRKN